MKRKLLLISIILVVVSTFQACKKAYLELEPKTNLMEPSFYKTEDDALKAVTAVYDALKVQNWAVVPLMSDIWSDDEYKGGNNSGDMNEYKNIEFQTVSAEDVNSVSNLWNRLYSGIYRANIYLSKQDGVSWTKEANKIRFEAETRFLRAYFYWDLARHYGWVPIITVPDDNVENYKNLKQNTPEQVYTQIASDLLFAVNNLTSDALPSTEAGRVTKYAAEGLLARIYLFHEGFVKNTPELGTTAEWTDGTTIIDKAYAQKAVDDIIAQTQYSLLTNYANLYDWEHENSTESIFEWQYTALGKSDDWNGWSVDGNFFVEWVGPRAAVGDATITNGWSLGMISWSLLNEFESGDPRKNATIYDASKKLTSYDHKYQNTGYFNYKYMSKAAFKASTGAVAHNWGLNYTDIRLADVYLMGAELYLTDNNIKATSYLNKVRTRSLPSGALSSITLDNIKHERRVELACEGHRKWDLMRWGLDYAKTMIDKTFDPILITPLAETMDDYPILGYLDKTNLGMLPIPGSEIRKANAGILEQKIAAYKK